MKINSQIRSYRASALSSQGKELCGNKLSQEPIFINIVYIMMIIFFYHYQLFTVGKIGYANWKKKTWKIKFKRGFAINTIDFMNSISCGWYSVASFECSSSALLT